MNSAVAARAVGATPPKGCFSAVRRSRAACRSSARGANANPEGQILSLVRRFGRPSPRRAFLRGANSFARAPCREAFAEESLLTWGKSFRSCAVSGGLLRGACSCGANSFARAPCREAFAEENLLAWGKFFRSCAVSGGLRRGEPSRVGQILSTAPRHRKTVARWRTPPRGAR